ncbi:DUF1453 domain-containing protein [Lysobacter koreensis]|uniref:DUF1453 domain-containing protein n=1 Tax=Lysobacter koreensis TaxID=266122 RepID=A0ABW2YP25_9GAMM
MPLLLIPIAGLAFVLLWLMLLPLALWQRYRRGHARRRAVPWAVSLNAWLLLASTGLFVLTAWLSGWWIAGALRHALLGLAAGVAVGIVGLWLTRFERDARGLHFAPNRWLVLALTAVVAARIGYGLWHAWQLWRADAGHAQWLAQQGNLLAVGGLLLGYYLAYAWGLRRRTSRLAVQP